SNFYRSWVLANDSNVTAVSTIYAEEEGITVWPNPAYQNIYIKFGEKTAGEVAVYIADVTGRELITKNLYVSSGLVLPINVTTLPAGIYFIKISGANYDVVTKFIRR